MDVCFSFERNFKVTLSKASMPNAFVEPFTNIQQIEKNKSELLYLSRVNPFVIDACLRQRKTFFSHKDKSK